MNSAITFLGTGSAFPSASYHSCCIIDTAADSVMIDAGGGNGIFDRLKAAGRCVTDLKRLHITHSHTDHLLGAVWLLRMLIKLHIDGQKIAPVEVYANAETAHALIEVCRLTLLKSYFDRLEQVAQVRIVRSGDRVRLADAEMEFIDCRSTGVSQTGIRLRLDSGLTIVHLGDEALTANNIVEAGKADVLICGAFCRYADREIFRPYEKHHHTMLDVARLAQEAEVDTLVTVHCEDRNPADRSRLYADEAAEVFNGRVVVPLDGERLDLIR